MCIHMHHVTYRIFTPLPLHVNAQGRPGGQRSWKCAHQNRSPRPKLPTWGHVTYRIAAPVRYMPPTVKQGSSSASPSPSSRPWSCYHPVDNEAGRIVDSFTPALRGLGYPDRGPGGRDSSTVTGPRHRNGPAGNKELRGPHLFREAIRSRKYNYSS